MIINPHSSNVRNIGIGSDMVSNFLFAKQKYYDWIFSSVQNFVKRKTLMALVTKCKVNKMETEMHALAWNIRLWEETEDR